MIQKRLLENYRLLIENTNTQIILLSDPETYSIVNTAHAKFCGKDKKDLENKKIYEILDKNVADYCIETNNKIFIEKNEVITKEYIQNNKGENRLLYVTKTPVLDAENNVQFIIIKAEDITFEDKFKLNNQQYSAIVENQDQLICRFLPDGELTFVNKAYCEYFNMEYKELVGVDFLTLVPEKEHEAIIEKLNSFTVENPVLTYEHRVIKANGEICWQRWTDQAFFDNGGNLLEFQSVGIDITNSINEQENLQNNYNKIEIEIKKRVKEVEEANIKLEKEILRRKKIDQKLNENIKLLKQSLNSSIHVILKMMEIRDPYTVNHQERVAYLAYSIGRQLRLSEDQLKAIYIGGLLHDVGKIYVPSDFLSKPTKLTDIEFNLIKTHSTIGYNILSEMKFPWPIDKIVYQHHERIDGSGYPLGLKDKDILIESKIIGLADVVEAMSSHRPYRPALDMDIVLQEINTYKGIRYDSDVVNACLKLLNDKNFDLKNDEFNLGELIE